MIFIFFAISVSIFWSFYEYLLLLEVEKHCTTYFLKCYSPNVFKMLFSIAVDFSFIKTCIECSHLRFL